MQHQMSASSIANYKACPVRFRLANREGIRPVADTESQRYGTNWHKLHEVYGNAFQYSVQDIPHDELEAKDYALQAVIDHLNQTYANCPLTVDAKDWAVERQVLLTSFIAYLWYWQNDPIEFLASEVPFKLPLHEPRTGLPLPTAEVIRVGKIDHIIRYQGAICALERKSTSRSIDPSSDYWEKSRKDTQVSMYALAFRDMNSEHRIQNTGSKWLPGWDGEARFGNTCYDVWKRPTIRPAMLTQKETAAFLATREYSGQSFEIGQSGESLTVNGEPVEVEQGKKAAAIRETTGMYGARLLADMQERPDFYFQRREIVRTDAEIEAFRRQLYAIYQGQKLMEKHNLYYENEDACRATFACPYIPICFGIGSQAVCDGHTVPNGFQRIFGVTVKGKSVNG